MKKLLFILAALMLIATACKKEDKKVDYKKSIVGEWHCTPAEIDADVYVSFAEDGSFDLFQKIGEGRHRHYTGDWAIEGKTLSGHYADGTDWGSAYTMDFSTEGTMVLTALNGSEEAMVYVKEEIPSDIRNGAVEVKSAYTEDIRPLL